MKLDHIAYRVPDLEIFKDMIDKLKGNNPDGGYDYYITHEDDSLRPGHRRTMLHMYWLQAYAAFDSKTGEILALDT
jgi:hypothetical protein